MTNADGSTFVLDPDLLARAQRLVVPGERRLLGITGPPGAGKSSLAEPLVAALGPSARLVAMDGFHLAQTELHRLGRQEHKGTPDTFDVFGYLALLRRLRDRNEEVVYAPRFDRALEEPIGSAIAVPRDVPLVVTEGNYLLLDSGAWAGIRPLLDECWYINPDEDDRLSWLIARHERYGRSPKEARTWSLGSDQRNAELIEATKHLADVVIRPGGYAAP
jgi:pantothenate kinase